CKAPAEAAGQMVNLACGESISLLELVADINAILGTDIPPAHAAPRPGDIKHSKADISRARALLGYDTQVTFQEGLQRTVDFFRSIS
ncbi:MAG: LPS biosynthesis protein WbpP, partial [Anaerolineae bacterium]|nr:LPS biosynthesis protein WbpP [Anaerolineae bacterium]